LVAIEFARLGAEVLIVGPTRRGAPRRPRRSAVPMVRRGSCARTWRRRPGAACSWTRCSRATGRPRTDPQAQAVCRQPAHARARVPAAASHRTFSARSCSPRLLEERLRWPKRGSRGRGMALATGRHELWPWGLGRLHIPGAPDHAAVHQLALGRTPDTGCGTRPGIAQTSGLAHLFWV
jgi:hypothetical protein